MRALILVAAAAVVLAGCGVVVAGAAASGVRRRDGRALRVARPAAWRVIEMTGGGTAVGFQSAAGAHGIPTQVGLGLSEDYPNSLEAAVDLVKGESRIVYPGYRITDERWVKVHGARAYRIDSVYESFAEQPSSVRNVDLYVQTDDRVQLNLFVRGPAEDWDEAR